MNYSHSFAQDLSILLKTGMPLHAALELQYQHHPDTLFKATLGNLLSVVLDGQPLSEALKQHPNLFGSYFIGMVKSGEASANLPSVLSRLASQLDRDIKLKKQVTSSLVYPTILVTVMFISLIIIFSVVIPQFAELFESYSERLDLATRAILSSAYFFEQWGAWMLLGSSVIVLGAYTYLKKQGKSLSQWLIVNTPYVKELYAEIDYSRFSLSLSNLLDSGIGQIEALQIASQSVSIEAHQKQVAALEANLRDGQTLGSCFPALHGINPLYAHSILSAELAGELPKALEHVATRMEENVTEKAARLAQIMEPLLVIILGSVIGVIVYGLFSSLQNLGNFSF